jgi:hypothetical protein
MRSPLLRVDRGDGTICGWGAEVAGGAGVGQGWAVRCRCGGGWGKYPEEGEGLKSAPTVDPQRGARGHSLTLAIPRVYATPTRKRRRTHAT